MGRVTVLRTALLSEAERARAHAHTQAKPLLHAKTVTRINATHAN